MTARLAATLLLLGALATAAGAQTFAPQPATGLSVSFQSERMGGSRILIFGEVRNSSASAYERVTLLAEGLDEAGRVVSRGRTWLPGTVAPRSQAPFELRLLAAGSEKRFRVGVETYQLAGREPVQSP